MWTPNYDQISGLVRVALPAITAVATAQGWLWVSTSWGQIGVVTGVTIASCIWDFLNNKSGKIVPSTLSGRLND